ncbi:MAG: GAF domain-containing protein [Chloroflexi bacterium]|nr:GAF domain-containing protein [Chloroflexota bacterium]
MTRFPDEIAEQTLQAMPDAVIAVNSLGHIQFMNTHAEELTGYSSNELLEKSIETLIPASQRAAHAQRRSQFHGAPTPRTMSARGDLQLLRKDGEILQVDISLSPIEGHADGIVLSAIRDVSEWERKSREEILLADIGVVAGNERDIEKVYEVLDSSLPRLIKFDRLVITAKIPDTNLVERVYVSGQSAPGEGIGTRVLAPDDSEILPGSQRNTTLTGSPDEVPFLLNGLQPWVQVPLGDPDSPSGYLDLRGSSKDAFSGKDLLFLARVANQISPALENARFYAQAHGEARERVVLSEISRIITSTSDMENVYRLTADQIHELVPFDRLVVSTIDQSRNLVTDRFVAGHYVPDGGAGSIYPLDKSATGELIQDLRSRSFNHLELEEMESRYVELEARRKAGLKSLVVAPLIWDDEAIGILILRSFSENAYGEPEAAIVLKIANQISGAVANAELVRRLEKEVAIQEALADISRSIISSRDIAEVIPEVVRAIKRLMPVDRLVISDVDEDKSVCGLRWSWGENDGPLAPDRMVPIAGTVTELAFRRGKTTVIEPEMVRKVLERNHKTPDADVNGDLNSWICAPLFAGKKGIGALHIRARDQNAYLDQHVQIVEMIGAQIAGAIANAQAHAQALESERVRIEVEAEKREMELLEKQRSNFLSTVSHELKTPLTSLVAFADILARNRDSTMNSRQLQQIQVMQRSARRLDLLINDLLDVSRLDAGTFTLTKSEFETSLLLTEIQAIFEPILEQCDQSLDVPGVAGPIWINADRDRVVQLITNLASNSSKYSLPGTKIRLALEIENGSLAITVSDSGIGMDEDTLENLFTPFYRSSDEHTQSQPGTGLGMVIVKSIVDLHDGTLSISSDQGVGTTIKVLLPHCSSSPSDEYLKSVGNEPKAKPVRSRLE